MRNWLGGVVKGVDVGVAGGPNSYLATRVLTSGIGVKACRFFGFVLGRAVGQGVVPPLSFLGDASQNCFVLLHFHFWRKPRRLASFCYSSTSIFGVRV